MKCDITYILKTPVAVSVDASILLLSYFSYIYLWNILSFSISTFQYSIIWMNATQINAFTFDLRIQYLPPFRRMALPGDPFGLRRWRRPLLARGKTRGQDPTGGTQDVPRWTRAYNRGWIIFFHWFSVGQSILIFSEDSKWVTLFIL